MNKRYRPYCTVRATRPFSIGGKRVNPGQVISIDEQTAATKVRRHKAVYVDEPKAATEGGAKTDVEGENKSAPQAQTQTKGKAGGRRPKRSK